MLKRIGEPGYAPILEISMLGVHLDLIVLCSTSEHLNTLVYDLFREIDIEGDGNSSRSAPPASGTGTTIV